MRETFPLTGKRNRKIRRGDTKKWGKHEGKGRREKKKIRKTGEKYVKKGRTCRGVREMHGC